MCQNYLHKFICNFHWTIISWMEDETKFDIDIHDNWIYIPKTDAITDARIDLVVSCIMSIAAFNHSLTHQQS